MNVHQKQVKHAFVYVPEGTTEVLNAAVVDAKSSYRTPSPMMREAPQIPNVPSTDRIYDNNHYKRDTVRNPEPPAVFIVESNAPICIEAPPQVLETGGSPGNNNPAVFSFIDGVLLSHQLTVSDLNINSLLFKHVTFLLGKKIE